MPALPANGDLHLGAGARERLHEHFRTSSNRDSALFDVWGLEFDPSNGAAVGSEYRVTKYDNPGRLISGTGSSELGVSATPIVLPIVETTGSIWVLEGIRR